MEIKDFFITPIYIILLSLLAYFIRPFLSNSQNIKYFLPALWVKFLGAIAVGMIYQFYYGGGGDTFMYFDLGSKYIWQAFLDNPLTALRIIFGPMEYFPEGFIYQNQIYTFGDEASFFVVRVAGLFDIMSFHSYYATSVFFAFFSFFGVWALFVTFQKLYPHLINHFAIGVLFLPSLFFWGSGLMKDTITFSSLGFLFYAIIQVFLFHKNYILNVILIGICFYLIYTVKIYILITFIPAVLVWLYFVYQNSIRNILVRIVIAPFLIILIFAAAFYSVRSFTSDSHRYSFDKLLITAEETAKWNYYVSVQQSGSGYTLGDYDFSGAGLARKFIPATLTAIFRPMIIEVNNPVMLLSAVENLLILFLVISVFKRFFSFSSYRENHLLVFCFLFVILFSFATGVTTYNFGALARYRIPMLPFLLSGLFILKYGNESK